jgi:hypothetical protein
MADADLSGTKRSKVDQNVHPCAANIAKLPELRAGRTAARGLALPHPWPLVRSAANIIAIFRHDASPMNPNSQHWSRR